MKKSIKTVALVAILGLGLCMLTGCGEKKEENKASTQNTASQSTSNTASNNGRTESGSNVIKVTFKVRNLVPDTTLTKLYLSGAGREEWGEELLNGQEMPTGTEVTAIFPIDKNNVKWDIKATDEAGQDCEFRNLDLSNVSTEGGIITLQLDENGAPVATAQ